MTLLILDPGHGGSDPGATNGTHQEKKFNLEIALKVREYLRNNYEVKIEMTRTKDTTLSLAARTNKANQLKGDYYCSLHINAGGGTGFESFIFNGRLYNETAQRQQVLHKYVMSKIASYGVRDRGMKKANFHVLRESNMPAILLENLFIDHSSDLKLLRDDKFINTLGNAIGEGLARALSLKEKVKSDPKPDPGSGTVYRVIAGSFAVRENAEKRRDMLKKNGIEAIVVSTKVDGSTRYRVQAGAFKERSNAEKRQKDLQKLGIDDAFITTE